MEIFGKRVKQELQEQNIQQKDLCEFLNVKKSTLSEWLNGKNEPPMRIIVQIAIFLEVTTDYLLGLENDNGSKSDITKKQ
ncbi:MAG: helix-turn-helix domain-containing protein [Clostridia bacterium]|nr:helix-turn-helix domain-containing protein [Clostridia bacterium]